MTNWQLMIFRNPPILSRAHHLTLYWLRVSHYSCRSIEAASCKKTRQLTTSEAIQPKCIAAQSFRHLLQPSIGLDPKRRSNVA